MKTYCWRILLVGAWCGALALSVHNSIAAEKRDQAAQPVVTAAKPAATPAADKYTLRYKFREGEEIRSKVSNLATIETTIAGNTQTTEMVSISTKLWRITGVDAASQITFEHTVEAVDMRNQMSGRQEVRYNSATDKTAPPGYADIAQTIGKPLTVVTIDPLGAVLKREQRQRTNLDNTGSVLVVPLPKEPIALGHVWTLPVEVLLPLKDGSHKSIQTRQRYELKKVEGSVATIAVETQILTPVSNPEIRAQLIQRMWQGTMDFDIDSGRMIGQRTDLDERVLGFSGPESSMHYVARVTEELLPAVAKTAAK